MLFPRRLLLVLCPIFFFSLTEVHAGSLEGFVVHHAHHSGEGLWWSSQIFNIIFPCVIVCGIRLLAHVARCCGWYCTMNGYCERKKKNWINVSFFSLCFVSLAVYIPLVCFIIIILFVFQNKRRPRLNCTNSFQTYFLTKPTQANTKLIKFKKTCVESFFYITELITHRSVVLVWTVGQLRVVNGWTISGPNPARVRKYKPKPTRTRKLFETLIMPEKKRKSS